jgi:hypothetical protein
VTHQQAKDIATRIQADGFFVEVISTDEDENWRHLPEPEWGVVVYDAAFFPSPISALPSQV